MTELALQRRFRAPVDLLWQGLTSPAALAQWFWPARFRTTAEVDLRVGGRFKFDGPGGGIAVSGHYTVVEVPTKLSFTWMWDGQAEETLVAVELATSGPDTDVVLTHRGFADEAGRDDHVAGWSDCLDRLPAWLAAPGIFAG